MRSSVSIDQLKVGVYIHLDMGWMDHPFSFSSFKIKSQEQIDTLRRMGLTAVRFDPSRSDAEPAPAAPAPGPAPVPMPDAAEDPQLAKKRERQERLKKQRETLARVERQYNKTAAAVRNLQNGLAANPARSLGETAALVQRLTTEFFAQPEITIHAVLGQPGAAESSVHLLNTVLLGLLVARELGLAAEEACLLGQGALYHDIGLQEVPSRILRKTDPLTAAERAARELHCEAGVRLGRAMALPEAVLAIIGQHHELADGSGYPHKLKGEAITLPARIVALVNQFDNLCNPVSAARALTPHEALSHLFSHQRPKYDARAMQAFIRCLGVYPPGTLVQLSNEALCLVSCVNTARPLKPTVVVFDPKTPRDTPILLDLAEEPELNISRALKPAQVAAPVQEYLSGRGRVAYFFESAAEPQAQS
ncbi:MAG TPA: DUF3391 domain-containing protein [Burkholderiales bacterium]|jgi:putative nucleotidyltransferase with HDIG domain